MAYSSLKWIENQARAGAPVYRYRSDRTGPDSSGANRFAAVHAVEIEYPFNSPDTRDVDWPSGDRLTATTMADYWANFIKTGKPNGRGLTRWPKSGKTRQVMYLDADSTAGPEQHRDHYEFHDKLAKPRCVLAKRARK